MMMFLSDTHLPQLLPVEAYCDEKWYAKEVSDVLLPGWHAVATTNQFPKNGSFITFDLFGHPLILRRERHEIHGFLNICPHRFSKLSTEQSGCKTTFKCGYHGWEFDECSGHTRRIPDAPSSTEFAQDYAKKVQGKNPVNVLALKDGVQGVLDKTSGKFTARDFTDAEALRYERYGGKIPEDNKNVLEKTQDFVKSYFLR